MKRLAATPARTIAAATKANCPIGSRLLRDMAAFCQLSASQNNIAATQIVVMSETAMLAPKA